MSLRFIELVIPENHAGDLGDVKETFGIIGLWTHSIDGGLAIVRVLVRSNRAEPVLKE